MNKWSELLFHWCPNISVSSVGVVVWAGLSIMGLHLLPKDYEHHFQLVPPFMQ